MVLVVGCDVAPGRPGDSPLLVVATQPSEGQVDVVRRGPFVIDFDRLLDPELVGRGSVRLVSGPVFELLSVRYEASDKRVIASLFGGSALEPNVGYRLELRDLTGLDGASLPEPPPSVRFTTGADVGPVPATPTATWSEVAAVFTSCAVEGCHGGEAPARGLDLSSPAAVETTAVGVAPQAVTGVLSRFVRVDRTTTTTGRADRSYLLYTLLEDAPISGERMPPPGPDGDAPPLSRGAIRVVERWIQGGAPTR